MTIRLEVRSFVVLCMHVDWLHHVNLVQNVRNATEQMTGSLRHAGDGSSEEKDTTTRCSVVRMRERIHKHIDTS